MNFKNLKFSISNLKCLLAALSIIHCPFSILPAQTPGPRTITYDTNFNVTATNKVTFVNGLAVTNAPSGANDIPRYLDLTNSTAGLQTQITSSTNRLATIESNTNTWNSTGTLAANATNRVFALESNTNTWNTAGTVAANATNRVLNLENNTNTWNTAGTVAANATNRVLNLESKTNLWNGALTNISSNIPWETWTGQGTPIMTANTNSVKFPLASHSDNNAGSMTNFPANVILTNSTNFKWSQSFYIGQLANSTYNNTTLTLSTFQNKTLVSYQTNFSVTIPVWNVPADRLRGKSVIIKSLWVNYNGAAASGNISVAHRILGSTNNVWVGGYTPWSGGNPHFTSSITVTATVPSVTNMFFLVSTNSIPSNATDSEASVFFLNDTTTFTTNLGLIAVYSEEIP